MRNKTATITAAILAGATWSSPALAQPTVPEPIVVEIDQRLVTGRTEQVHINQPLDAGVYTMTVETSDGYEGRNALTKEQKARQSSERVTVLGHTTGDLDDASEAVSAADTFTVELPERVEGFHVEHAGTGVDWDSVNVDAVTFTRVPDPEPELPVEVTVPEPVAEPAPPVSAPTTIPAPTPEPTTPPATTPELPETEAAVPTPVERVPYTG